jgi:hypothetical protein
MKEDFLHYLWKYKKFNWVDLKTTQNEPITIINAGDYLQKTGPDFFNAQLIIGTQKWAGNIEIHLKSSDWYLHEHQEDSNYFNVILHVVWEHDTDIFDSNNQPIPTLELKNYVDYVIHQKYIELSKQKSWIYCENQLENVSKFTVESWLERLYFERIEQKATLVHQIYKTANQDWEATLFILLSKNFGLNTNGISFMKMAQSIPFSVIKKERFEVENLEALFFGRCRLLIQETEDNYAQNLQKRWEYLKVKHQLEDIILDPIEFFKHRPDNFPTIRLSQLAHLFNFEQNIFSKIIEDQSIENLRIILKGKTSQYWLTHYTFDKESPKKSKVMSDSFIDLLLINTIIPLKFYYAKVMGKEIDEELLELSKAIPSEKNMIIDKFKNIGIKSLNSMSSQSLITLKKEYCEKKIFFY